VDSENGTKLKKVLNNKQGNQKFKYFKRSEKSNQRMKKNDYFSFDIPNKPA
jgi:hypothetical protein